MLFLSFLLAPIQRWWRRYSRTCCVVLQAALAITHLDRVMLWGKQLRVMPSKHQQVQMPREGQAEDLTKDFSNRYASIWGVSLDMSDKVAIVLITQL